MYEMDSPGILFSYLYAVKKLFMEFAAFDDDVRQ